MSRFLFATMPIVGHVAPIAPVARKLINRGHEVTWYTFEALQGQDHRDPSYRLGAAEIQRDFASHDGPAEAADLLEQLAATRKPVLRSAS